MSVSYTDEGAQWDRGKTGNILKMALSRKALKT